MNRKDQASQEATRDPIFLFQKRIFQWLAVPPGYDLIDGDFFSLSTKEYISDLEVYYDCKSETHCFGDFDLPYAVVEWHTERVFLTRSEAEAFGKAKDYNYRDGWRVYCVPCEGELCERLEEASVVAGIETTGGRADE